MLVLSRKLNEEIVVGDDVRIKVLKVAGNKVTLGICAPDEVRIMRCEIADQEQQVPNKPAEKKKSRRVHSRSGGAVKMFQNQ